MLKEINPEYPSEGLMLKLKLQYFGHLMWRANSLEKTLMLGKTEGRKRKGWQKMRWLDDIPDSMDMVWAGSRSQWWTGKPGVLNPWDRKESDTTERLNWTELTRSLYNPMNLNSQNKVHSSLFFLFFFGLYTYMIKIQQTKTYKKPSWTTTKSWADFMLNLYPIMYLLII